MKTKHILVSITHRNVLHWRLIAARPNGKYWEISIDAYDQFLRDIGYSYNPEHGRSATRVGQYRIILG